MGGIQGSRQEKEITQILMGGIMKPYKHDCEDCVWVGWFSPYSDKPRMNVYLCKGETVIIRFSDEPGDYWSKTVGESIKE